MAINARDDEQRKLSLSQIETRWSLIQQAHEAKGDEASSARSELMVRYAGAVNRYLLRVARDHDLAADLAQEFALRFLRGDFQHADPSRGRFRNYVRSALHNLLVDHQRRQRNQPKPLPDEGQTISDTSEPVADFDREFLDCWRDEILSRAWERLARQQDQNGQPFFTVLRFRAEHPALRSHEIAERLSVTLGKPVNAVWVRQNLKRARERFVEFIHAEVTHSLGNPTPEEFDDEMINLGLSAYCREDRG